MSAVRSRFGWCASDKHGLCRVAFRSHFDVNHECSCDCHDQGGAA